ncbi:MAG TPA: caspase family protein, partial [Flavihumibacter sp.]|nr:caspase family protein [Flavihumibacter sp.]
MSRGISLHVGLNHVDTSQYPDYIIPELAGCINDANAMKAIASATGFSSTQVFLDAQGTALAVKNKISQAARELVAGDIFFLTYSGHGGQIPDETGDEDDNMDETWIMYDRQLLDDELYSLWCEFAAGVRIFVLSDSCHSGTMVKYIISDYMKQDKQKSRSIGD